MLRLPRELLTFTSGSCYAINGNFAEDINYIFIITPESVDISGDFQEIFRQLLRFVQFRQIFVNSITIKIYDVI